MMSIIYIIRYVLNYIDTDWYISLEKGNIIKVNMKNFKI